MKEMFLNETNAEIAAAANSSEVERIESGNISSHERAAAAADLLLLHYSKSMFLQSNSDQNS